MKPTIILDKLTESDPPEIEFARGDILPFLLSVCERDSLDQEGLEDLISFFQLDTFFSRQQSEKGRFLALLQEVAFDTWKGRKSEYDIGQATQRISLIDEKMLVSLKDMHRLALSFNGGTNLSIEVARRINEFLEKHREAWA